MQFHLETIPVWAAVEHAGPCPICELHNSCEQNEVERSLGGSVMEPSERVRVNKLGFCPHHHEALKSMNNRLGHALMVDSHAIEKLETLRELDKNLQSAEKGGLFSKKDALPAVLEALKEMNTSCVICDNVNTHMKRYLDTFVYLWHKEESFATAVEKGGICLPHAQALMEASQHQLSKPKQSVFARFLLALLLRDLTEDEADLKWFTLKFDYRNQDKPWGNSKNALERTITLLRGQ